MYWLAGVVMLAACGRFDFDARADRDATVDVPSVTSYVATVLADAPIVYYRLDETSGTTAADASGHGQDGLYFSRLGGAVDYARAGALVGDPDTAAAFQGDGNPGIGGEGYVRVPDTLPSPWAGDFSVEVWVAPGMLPPATWDDLIFVEEDYLVAGFRFGWTMTLYPEVWTDEAGGTSDVFASAPLLAGAWNHLVLTKAGTQVTIYLQGVEVASAPVVYHAPGNTAENCVGSCHGMPSAGTFDELAIYDHALTPARVLAHYTAGST